MIIRLHNLSMRPPSLTDLQAVIELATICEHSDSGGVDATEEDIRQRWQLIDLQTNAWVVMTNKGQLVSYADIVQEDKHEQLTSSVYIHPDYRERGIATLLTWLIEERARQIAHHICSERRVVLSHTVSSLNTRAHRLLEREGYTLAQRFWRLTIERDELFSQPFDTSKFKVDLVVDVPGSGGRRNTGMYVAQQYEVYEKELRAGKEDHLPCLA